MLKISDSEFYSILERETARKSEIVGGTVKWTLKRNEFFGISVYGHYFPYETYQHMSVRVDVDCLYLSYENYSHLVERIRRTLAQMELELLKKYEPKYIPINCTLGKSHAID